MKMIKELGLRLFFIVYVFSYCIIASICKLLNVTMGDE